MKSEQKGKMNGGKNTPDENSLRKKTDDSTNNCQQIKTKFKTTTNL